jgi:hypothetical protein
MRWRASARCWRSCGTAATRAAGASRRSPTTRRTRPAAAARDLLAFTFDPDTSAPSAAGTLLLRLRWEAAREFGLVEGQAWKVLAIQELSEDPSALTEVVLGSSPR